MKFNTYHISTYIWKQNIEVQIFKTCYCF